MGVVFVLNGKRAKGRVTSLYRFYVTEDVLRILDKKCFKVYVARDNGDKVTVALEPRVCSDEGKAAVPR